MLKPTSPMKLSAAPKFHSTWPESVLSEVILGSVHQCIAPFPRQKLGKRFHQANVCVHVRASESRQRGGAVARCFGREVGFTSRDNLLGD